MFQKRTPTPKRKDLSAKLGTERNTASVPVHSACSSRSVANETGGMSLLECSVLITDDSGEVRENELMLEEDDDNDVTKDLDVSRMSPSLFPVSPKKVRPTGDADTTVTQQPSASGPELLTEKLRVESVRSAVSEFYETGSLEPSVGNISAWATSIGTVTGAVSNDCCSAREQDCRAQRQTIGFAIQELNAMTDEMLQFIKAFETKHPECKDPSKL